MFDELGTKLDGALKKLRQRGVLTEPMIKEGLREVRRVLLEADVNFRITIPVTSSGGEVMAVPLAALSAGSDGTTRVEVETSPGETKIVVVNPGLRAQGLVQVDPIDGTLEAGDRVVVGRDLILPGPETTDDEAEDG